MVTTDPIYEFKRKFADLWLRNPSHPYECMLELIPEDHVQATIALRHLIHDPEVRQIKEALLEEHGEEHFLPTKAKMIRTLLDASRNASEDGFVKMMKLAAEMRGFIDKTGVTINNTTHLTNNRVMVVPAIAHTDNGTIDADKWEQQAIEQQVTLTN